MGVPLALVITHFTSPDKNAVETEKELQAVKEILHSTNAENVHILHRKAAFDRAIGLKEGKKRIYYRTCFHLYALTGIY